MALDFTLIKQANITQRDFARAVGVTPTTVNLWINTERVPSKFLEKEVKTALGAIKVGIKAGLFPLPRRNSLVPREDFTGLYPQIIKTMADTAAIDE